MNATQYDASQACVHEDSLVTISSALRVAVLADITMHHLAPRKKEESPGCLAFAIAFRDFCLHGGEHMVIYFATSCALDTFAVFGTQAPLEGGCRADMLMALYSAALVTFLPNAAFAYWLRSTNRHGQMTLQACGWSLAASLLAALSFWGRLVLVGAVNYVDFVHSMLLALPWLVRAVLAVLTPPLVDLCQSLILIAASTISKEARAREATGYVAPLA